MADSFLSGPNYGYDLVFAVTQQSLNATMHEYLRDSSQAPDAPGPTRACYIADNAGNPQPIAWELLMRSSGVDPFSLPNGGTPNTSPEVASLKNAGFMFGFSITPGLPDGYGGEGQPPLPDVITMTGGTADATFNMLASNFQIAWLDSETFGDQSFTALSQQPSSAWITQASVNLVLNPVNSADFTKLPSDVLTRIEGMGGLAPTVQQLLFDLNQVQLQKAVEISGLPDGSLLETTLSANITNMYFTNMKEQGQPLLHLNIIQGHPDSSALCATSMDTEVCSLVDSNGNTIPFDQLSSIQKEATTMNYLYNCLNTQLPPVVSFKWNWADATDLPSVDGVISINRNTLANWISNQLLSAVIQVCAKPYVSLPNPGFSSVTIRYSQPMQVGNHPTVTTTSSGPNVLNMHWYGSSSDNCGSSADGGAITLSTTYDLTLSFTGDKITVQQHLVWNISVSRTVAMHKDTIGANIIDKTVVDTYTLAVGDSGNMQQPVDKTSTNADNSMNLANNSYFDYFTNLDALVDDVRASLGPVSTNITSFGMDTQQNYIFPGGKVFSFRNMQFSANQDLYSQIVYASQVQGLRPIVRS